MTEEGVGEVLRLHADQPVPSATDRHLLVRMVRCVRGQMDFEVEVAPRFDYGRAAHQTHLTE